MINVDALEQVADIFTKPFAEKTKWLHALRLINRNHCPDIVPKKGKDSESHLVAKPTMTAPSYRRPVIGWAAEQLLRTQDFSYSALQSLASQFPTKVSRRRRRRRSRLTTSEESCYHNWGFFSFSGMQGITAVGNLIPLL